jgi:hypothetical protein
MPPADPLHGCCGCGGWRNFTGHSSTDAQRRRAALLAPALPLPARAAWWTVLAPPIRAPTPRSCCPRGQGGRQEGAGSTPLHRLERSARTEVFASVPATRTSFPRPAAPVPPLRTRS